MSPDPQLAYDADVGDVIWDPITDNVFEAQIGDGIIYYGASMLIHSSMIELSLIKIQLPLPAGLHNLVRV